MATVKDTTLDWRADPEEAQTVVGGETIGGATKLPVDDNNAQQVLKDIALSLRKIEYHLSLMTDADLDKGNL